LARSAGSRAGALVAALAALAPRFSPEERREKLRLLHGQQVAREFLVGGLGGQAFRYFLPQLLPRRAAHRGEAVERRAGLQAERGEVEDPVADRDPASRLLGGALLPEHAEGQVLDREVAAGLVGRVEPALQVGVVGRVHGFK